MADVVYADRTDFARFGVMASATLNVPDATIDAALIAASADMDSYFRARYSLPLLEWDSSVRMYCCWLAQYLVMYGRGVNPDSGADIIIQDKRDKAIAWCEGVERQRVHPKVTETPKAAPAYEYPQVATLPKAGW